ncbi:MAG: ATP-binding protein, partial [Pseudomonadota bacterium]
QVDDLIAAREAEAERARRRAADLAHGLKTPLQALVGEASRLRARGQTAAAEGIEEIATAMRRHVDRELVRARAAARAPGASSAPAEVIDRVLAVLARTPEGRELEWPRRASGELRAGIDADDLTEALGAVMENAARHARGRVETEVLDRGGRVVVRVRDDGPGIPEAEAQRLLGRNERLDTAGPGTGLGLSIAREILEAVGGELKLSSGGGGLEADLVLPRAQPSPEPEAR